MALPHQDKVSRFYNSTHIQISVALLIAANFLTNIIEKEIDAHGENYPDVFAWFGHFYNLMFTIELGFNMYAHWWRPFWKSNWNIFDVVVVSIGVINTLNLPLPPAFGLLRMMRAFRVFRLFKRVHSLNKIIVAIMHAVPGVANAFLILGIVMSIYAILAVEFYMDLGAGCTAPDAETLELKRWETARGFCMGDEYFGTFTKALYSFFQVLTGESWVEMVARPGIFFWSEDWIRALGGAVFFVSYMLIGAFVLTNVVVAVLLDKMVDPETAEKVEELINAPDDEDEQAEGDAEENKVAKVEATPSIPIRTTDEFDQAMTCVTNQVQEYMEFSEKMSPEFDTLQSDMASMRAQVANMILCMSGGANNIEK